MSKSIYQHWHIEKDDNQIMWLGFDRKNKAVNTIDLTVLAELDSIIKEIENDGNLKGVILLSKKETGFIAGADIEAIADSSHTEGALEAIRSGQQVFLRFEQIKVPTVALITGFCLGGGLELALSCRYRVAEDSPKTRLGLPEVMLGIHPGWGGTVRLPRLISVKQAFNLILNGHTVRAKQAKRIGFVDAAVPERQLHRAAEYFIINKPSLRKAPWHNAIFNIAFVRTLFAKIMRSQVKSFKFREEHYPAPYAAIDNWEKYGVTSNEAFKHETDSICRLVETDTARNLLRVFTLQNLLKSSGNKVDFKVRRVHVIGGGVMGGDIAAWCAMRGFLVTLQDREPKYIAPAIARAYKLFKKKLKEPRLVTAAMDRLIPDVEGLGVKSADVIIEAIFENLEAKQKLFREIEEIAKEDAIIATNTSSIPLEAISQGLKTPSRLVGIHFFNPVSKMQLVEVVKSKICDPEVLDKAIAFVRQIDRLPLPVADSPGFLINRILMPYLMECVTLLDEGVPGALIDEAAERFGMRMGPVELADKVGLDICLNVAENLTKAYGGSVPERLKDMVAKGHLGEKSGKGFYQYKKGKVKKPSVTQMQRDASSIDDITDRLILRLGNEAVACLRENVVKDDDYLDAGMIFGTGFAPFRGGPIHYAKARGILKVTEQLQKLQSRYGSRFQADEEWDILNSN